MRISEKIAWPTLLVASILALDLPAWALGESGPPADPAARQCAQKRVNLIGKTLKSQLRCLGAAARSGEQEANPACILKA